MPATKRVGSVQTSRFVDRSAAPFGGEKRAIRMEINPNLEINKDPAYLNTQSPAPGLVNLFRVEDVLNLARANSRWKHFAAGQRTLVVFHGPHRYVSPHWYRSPLNVPTRGNEATIRARDGSDG